MEESRFEAIRSAEKKAALTVEKKVDLMVVQCGGLSVVTEIEILDVVLKDAKMVALEVTMMAGLLLVLWRKIESDLLEWTVERMTSEVKMVGLLVTMKDALKLERMTFVLIVVMTVLLVEKMVVLLVTLKTAVLVAKSAVQSVGTKALLQASLKAGLLIAMTAAQLARIKDLTMAALSAH